MAQLQIQTTTVNVRVDEDIKRNVESLFESMGMNISTAVNMFFRQCLFENAIPFQPRGSRNVSRKEALKEAKDQVIVNGTSEMLPDEINAIINEVRKEKRRAEPVLDNENAEAWQEFLNEIKEIDNEPLTEFERVSFREVEI